LFASKQSSPCGKHWHSIESIHRDCFIAGSIRFKHSILFAAGASLRNEVVTVRVTIRQGRIQPVRLGRAISVIFGSQVWNIRCCKRDKYNSQHVCNKTMDDKMALYRECCFSNCKISWWIN